MNLKKLKSYERYKIEECINMSSRRRKIRADQLRVPTNKKVSIFNYN